MQDFRELGVWQKAHATVLAIYQLTGDLPQSEKFGLTIQLRRSASSVAMRIAEGCGRSSDIEFAVELRRATAASSELEYLVLLARDLAYLEAEQYEHLSFAIIEVRKMLSGLMKKLSLTCP